MSPEQVRNEIVRLAHRGLGVAEYSLAAARALRRAVPFDGVCVVTMGPATHLVTGDTIENGLPESVLLRYAEIEAVEEDFNKFAALARAQTPAATLSAATEGKLDRSLRHRELRRPSGYGGDELRAAWADWGGIVLLRETGRPDFTPADVDLMAALSARLADGLRRALAFSALAGAPAAVIVEVPRAPELAPLIAEAYGLTAREREITRLVAQGLSTDEIATRAFVTPYTVQDHLKSIFEKTGTGSRGELVARRFFNHYADGLL